MPCRQQGRARPDRLGPFGHAEREDCVVSSAVKRPLIRAAAPRALAQRALSASVRALAPDPSAFCATSPTFSQEHVGVKCR